MSPRSIVVVDTMGGLGDLVLALPMIRALGATHPAADLHVVTTAPWHALLERDSALASVTPVRGRDGGTVQRVVADALERIRPDLAITTNRQHGLPELLERFARTAVTDLWRRPPADELVDVRYCRLLAEDGWIDPRVAGLAPTVVLGDDEVAAAAALLADLAPAGAPVLCFPDSGMPVKRWPASAWGSLIGSLRREGRAPVVVTEEESIRDALRAAGAVPAPAMPVRGLAALAAAAAARGGVGVGGDTGPVRLATAAGLSCVGLYGPTVPGRYGLRAPSVDLIGLPDCSVRTPTAITEQQCWWTAECPLSADRTPACMADIAPAAVLAALPA